MVIKRLVSPIRRRVALVLAGWLAAGPALAASPAIVVEYETDRVLAAVDAQQLWYPASLTKLMTVYLAFEELAAGRLDAAQKLTASAAAAAQTGTRLGLAKGASVTVLEALEATILRSANDAAVVLAERIAGSEEAFAARMTERARSLGLRQTVFRNATGLPDPQQWTTAADMAILARALLHDFPDRYALFATRTMTYQGRSYGNINGLLGSFPGADGLKTGFTCGAGYNIVASAQSGGRRLIAVLLGATSLDARRSAVTHLLQAGFSARPPADGAKPAVTLASFAASDLGTPGPTAAPIKPALLGECGSDRASAHWALTFGNTHQEGLAKDLLAKAKAALGGAFKGAHPVIVHRHVGGLPPYRALAIGYDETQAIATCLRLRRLGIYCLVLNPEQLKSPQALWN